MAKLVYSKLYNTSFSGSLKKAFPKFYMLWEAQRARCNNESHPAYKNYGAKGIRVDYSAFEFVQWCIKNHSYKSDAVVGRIDHSKNYSLDNIQSENRAASTRERNSRHGLPSRARAVYSFDYKTGEILGRYSTMKECAEAHNVCATSVLSVCAGRYKKTNCGMAFFYAE